MARTNDEVAAALREYAELLAITGGDPFRARNYEKAAKEVAGYPGDLGASGGSALPKIPGVGNSIAGKITEYLRTGTIRARDDLRAKVPPGVLDLAKVPGLGPKRALRLSRELDIASLEDLEAAVRHGRLRGLPGFGARSEERLLKGIATVTSDAALRAALGDLPREATEDQIVAVLAAELGITARGAQRGSRDGTRRDGTRRDEASRGTADADPRPALIRTADLHGDLHTHTDLTDGIASLEEMLAAASARGYAYYAVTDHAPNLVMQRMTEEKMLAQRGRLRAAGAAADMTPLHGTELNIAPDGSVDWDEDFLSGFDMCVASVQTEDPIPKHMNCTRPRLPANAGRCGGGVKRANLGWTAVSDHSCSWSASARHFSASVGCPSSE